MNLSNIKIITSLKVLKQNYEMKKDKRKLLYKLIIYIHETKYTVKNTFCLCGLCTIVFEHSLLEKIGAYINIHV